MPGKTYRLEVHVTGSIESRGDHWAAFNNEFGITAYGGTSDEAEDRLNRSLKMMLDRLVMRGPDAVRTRLESLGLPYLMVEQTDSEPPMRRFDVTLRELVPA